MLTKKQIWRRKVHTDQRWDEGVGAGGGQPGSSSRVWRSLSADNPLIFKSPMGAGLKATQDGGGSQPEEQHDLAAEVLRIIRAEKPRYGGVCESIPVPTII
jgi:hypothetical protein